MAGNAAISNHVFHNAITVAGTGNVYNVCGQADTMKLEFSISTSGTFSATVEAQAVDTNKWYNYGVLELPLRTALATITDATVLYDVDLRGITKLRVNVSTVTGTLTVQGRAVG